MEPPTITVEIDTQGNVVVEVHKAQGVSCTALTADLEKALGKVTERTKKPEYNYLGGGSGQQQKIGG